MDEKTDLMKDVIYINRKKKHLTQEQLADMLNVSNKTISKWERGAGYPDVQTIPTLAKILDIPIQTLFNSEDLKPELIAKYNHKILSKYKCHMILSILLFLISPSFYLICAFAIENYGMLGIFLSVVLMIISIIIAIMESIKIYDLIVNTYRNEKYIRVFKNYLLIYSFLIFIPSVLATALFKKEVIIIIMATIVYLLYTLISLFVIKQLKVNIKNKRNMALLIITGVLFLVGFFLMIFMQYPSPYILFYIASLFVNYTTLFISKDINK